MCEALMFFHFYFWGIGGWVGDVNDEINEIVFGFLK